MKGYTIDGDYLINMKDVMEVVDLPYPRKRTNTLRNGDETLPIITITTKLWS